MLMGLSPHKQLQSAGELVLIVGSSQRFLAEPAWQRLLSFAKPDEYQGFVSI